ncbi:MAG: IPT/TIG domain-containing protein, partial [Planctomycetes bacterium]|nr:IPT/TIG domain-containing protein [Planctomycetota bacterium]
MRSAAPFLALMVTMTFPFGVHAQPSISSFQPFEVSYLGQTPYTLIGTGFTPGLTSGTVVQIDGVNTTLTSVTSTQITGVVPPHAVTGTPVAVAVLTATGPSATLPDAVSYIGPLAVESVSPAYVAGGFGGTIVSVVGVGFTPNSAVTLTAAGGVLIPVAESFVDARHLTFITPTGISPGIYGVRVVTSIGIAGITADLPNALTVVGAIDLQDFDPQEVSLYGDTPFVATGTGFTPSTTLILAGETVVPTFVSTTTLTGWVPANPGLPLGAPVAATANDPVSGSDTLASAYQYVGPFDLTSVSPPVWQQGSSTDLELLGSAFTPSTHVEIGGLPVGSVFLGQGSIRVVPPASLPPGLYDVRAYQGTSSRPLAEDTLPLALTIASSSGPVLTGVEPSIACAAGGTFARITGSNFIPETAVWIGSQRLLEKVVDEDGTTITGMIPGLSPSSTAGPVLVTVSDFRGEWESSDLLAYSKTCATLRPVEQLESSLAYGTARFSWHNPEAYTSIRVLDLDGTLIDVLPAGSTSYEYTAGGGSTSVGLQFQGVTDGDISRAVPEYAQVLPCNY